MTSAPGSRPLSKLVMPGLVPGIHVFRAIYKKRRGWSGQARPWRRGNRRV